MSKVLIFSCVSSLQFNIALHHLLSNSLTTSTLGMLRHLYSIVCSSSSNRRTYIQKEKGSHRECFTRANYTLGDN